jgi:hypothetical protein
MAISRRRRKAITRNPPGEPITGHGDHQTLTIDDYRAATIGGPAISRHRLLWFELKVGCRHWQ